MYGNYHLLFSLSVGSMIALNLDKVSAILPNIECSSNSAALFMVGGVLGGLLPDMDNPSSYIAKLTKPISTVICKMQKIFDHTKKNENHRGFLHDPILHIACLICSYIFSPVLVGLFVGGLTHVFLDMYNPIGVPFLFGAKTLHLGRIYANSKQATKFTALCIAVTLCLGVSIHYLGNYIISQLQ